MQKNLIIEAYIKAKEELISKGVNSPSNHQAAILISDFILDELGFSISKRSIANYYKSAIEISESEDIGISQKTVVLGFCNFLGYATYKDFTLKLKSTETEEIILRDNKDINKTVHKNPKKSIRNFVVAISVGVFIIAGILIFKTLTKDRWMIWKVDRYEEVDFNKKELSNGVLKLFKEERIDNFKKINNPDCDYKYFNEDGSVKVWYGKNEHGELEIFTDIGLHPETGKSLKPITAYMIRKYLCDSI